MKDDVRHDPPQQQADDKEQRGDDVVRDGVAAAADVEGLQKTVDQVLKEVWRGRAGRLSDSELLQLPQLYRAALSSLSVARATALDASLIAYLESLATRAYFFVYGTRTRLLQKVTGFFRHDWPMAVRGLWRETLVLIVMATLLMVAAVRSFKPRFA